MPRTFDKDDLRDEFMKKMPETAKSAIMGRGVGRAVVRQTPVDGVFDNSTSQFVQGILKEKEDRGDSDVDQCIEDQLDMIKARLEADPLTDPPTTMAEEIAESMVKEYRDSL